MSFTVQQTHEFDRALEDVTHLAHGGCRRDLRPISPARSRPAMLQRGGRLTLLSLAGVLACVTPPAPIGSGGGPGVLATEVHMTTAQIGIPESMRIEHAEIHAELERMTRMPGRIGTAAGELAAVLHRHFTREEQIALPPLSLLEPLARGEATSNMLAVLPMTDALRAELPRMLEEHKAIRAATMRLRDIARAERDAAAEHFADKLALHARSEEEMFYPAAVLVGDLVRARVPLAVRPHDSQSDESVRVDARVP